MNFFVHTTCSCGYSNIFLEIGSSNFIILVGMANIRLICPDDSFARLGSLIQCLQYIAVVRTSVVVEQLGVVL